MEDAFNEPLCTFETAREQKVKMSVIVKCVSTNLSFGGRFSDGQENQRQRLTKSTTRQSRVESQTLNSSKVWDYFLSVATGEHLSPSSRQGDSQRVGALFSKPPIFENEELFPSKAYVIDVVAKLVGCQFGVSQGGVVVRSYFE